MRDAIINLIGNAQPNVTSSAIITIDGVTTTTINSTGYDLEFIVTSAILMLFYWGFIKLTLVFLSGLPKIGGRK